MNNLSNPEARAQAFRAAIADSVSAMVKAAEILKEMEAANDDIGFIPVGTIRILRQINSGLLLPEVATRFGGSLRTAIGKLPAPEQRKALDPEFRVEVLISGGDKVSLPLDHLSPSQVKQVFGDGFIRGAAEQKAQQATASKKENGPQEAVVKFDKRGGNVFFDGRKISKSTLLEWLREI